MIDYYKTCAVAKPVDKKKKINIPSLIRFIPFRSKLFCAGFSGEKPGREGMGKELYEKFLRF